MSHTEHRFVGADHWNETRGVKSRSYRCSYCSADVGSSEGWQLKNGSAQIVLCPHCQGPTFFDFQERQWPGSKVGASVAFLAGDVQALYEEARASVAANAFTGAVMLCRTILMHVAVEKGAEENQNFKAYVEWLINERYAPKGAEVWLDYIRQRGNDANHEIVLMTRDDAEGVVLFTEALLRAVYELPSLVPQVKPPPSC